MCTYPEELCDRLEHLDTEIVPDFCNPECMYTRDQWYRQAEERQELAFEEALDKLYQKDRQEQGQSF